MDLNPAIIFLSSLCGIVAAAIAHLKNRNAWGWLVAGTFVPVVTILIMIAAMPLPERTDG